MVLDGLRAEHPFQALEGGGDAFTIRDARAAVFQRMGRYKDALRDSKVAIDLQPDRWQVIHTYQNHE